jgi:hypothetical protein
VARTTAYLQIVGDVEKDFGGRERRERLAGIRVVAVTQRRPRRPQAGAIVHPIEIEVAPEWFTGPQVQPTKLSLPAPPGVNVRGRVSALAEKT